MCIAVVGDTERSEWRRLQQNASKAGFELWLLDGSQVETASRIADLDAVVILGDHVADEVREKAVLIASDRNVPAFCAECEGAALCGFLPH